jgi:hypothetical protein
MVILDAKNSSFLMLICIGLYGEKHQIRAKPPKEPLPPICIKTKSPLNISMVILTEWHIRRGGVIGGFVFRRLNEDEQEKVDHPQS